jgi:hypothetical protein
MSTDPVIDRLRRANPAEVRPLSDESGLRSRVLAGFGDPRLAGPPTTRRRRRLPALGTVASGLSVVIAIGVAILVVTALRHQPAARDAGHGAGAAPARVIAMAPDPSGGLPWGLRAVHTRRGQTCLQVGRLHDGTIGVLGQDGAWANDHGFHPIPTNTAGFGGPLNCGEPDRNGHAFINITDHDAVENAAGDAAVNGDARGAAARVKRCPQSSSTGRPLASPSVPCPAGALRDLAYGLLGPDATRITYVGADGARHTQPTIGPDGAYLIVRPQTACVELHAGRRFPCDLGSIGPLLGAGVITTVTYRDGRVCHLPPPSARGAITQASCPLVGYVSPPFPHVTRAQVAAPVTVRVLPAKHYCTSNGHNIPGCKEVRLRIVFTARVAVSNANSYYEALVNMPPRDYTPGAASGCPGGAQGIGPTGRTVISGQQVTFAVDFGSHVRDCIGDAIHITVAYVPDSHLGLKGLGSEPFPSPGRGAIIVGRASTVLP